jgi:hypothetical protein
MYAQALAHLMANLHRLTPKHAALVRLWHGIAAERGLTAGQARAVVTVYERLTGEQGEYAMNKIQPKRLWELEELGESITALARGAMVAVDTSKGLEWLDGDVMYTGFFAAKELLANNATEEQIAVTIWERLADILETTKQTIVVEDGK